MIWWTPECFSVKRDNLERRAGIVTVVQSFFLQRGFLDVETPSLQVSSGTELHTVAFSTELIEPFTNAKHSLYLHTSPELSMKKLLTAGLSRIVQRVRVYRNSERSLLHYPEFSMLEWYRVNTDYYLLMEDCEALLQEVMITANYNTFFRDNRYCNPYLPWKRISVIDIFTHWTGINLLQTIVIQQKINLILFSMEADIPVNPTNSWEDIFFQVMLEEVEIHLGSGEPVALYNYPIPLAACAKICSNEANFVERFEIYICGIEIANAYSELTDIALQRARFHYNTLLRKKLYSTRILVDEDFLHALAHMPESAGIALGFDRLVMLVVGSQDIEEVLWVPIEKATSCTTK